MWYLLHYNLLFLCLKNSQIENQDGDVGGHTAPPRTTRTDRKSNGKEVPHQVDKKETYIQTSRRGRDGHQGREDSVAGRDQDWWSVERMGQAVSPLADPVVPHSRTDKPGQTAGNKADHTTQGSSTRK